MATMLRSAFPLRYNLGAIATQRWAAATHAAFSTKKMVDPRTGKVFNEVTLMTAHEVEEIMALSDQAFRQWRRVSPSDRISRMSALAEKLRERTDEAAHLMNQEMGKPMPQAKAEVMKCVGLIDWYAKHGPEMLEDTPHPPLPGFKKSYVAYRPLGVILSIMPWNFPFWQVIRMAVPTMMAGNAVLLKHAPSCFGSGLLIEEIIREVQGLPENVFRSLSIGSPMVASVLESPIVQGVALTGSEAAGKAVASKAGSLLKKAVVELGGNDAYAVLADADLDVAANAVVTGRLINTGQVCIAPKRVIVDKSVKAEFEQKVLEVLSQKTYGIDFGTMSDAGACREVEGQIKETLAQGGRLLAGGVGLPAPEGDIGGAYCAPTVITDVKPGMIAFEEEVFGPLIAICDAEDEQHIMELANKSDFGLGGAVFTRDLAKGERLVADELEVGMGFVNDFVRSDPSLPFGGVKSSGLGRECSVFGLREFANIKTICVK
eukprot:TRINITY_DN10493_c0_g1_i3.p1 TRINITY_DN10493_c0_g1~~TRINITY_DN10493_c0_g1_i3.p1  ORF type:complete len:489 (-),score=88.55 TRINITY_DN10493_c0_g1_i3:244-1710(-)